MNIEYESNYPAFENRDYYITIGEHISFYRRQANMTQEVFAKKLNITRAYLSRIESSNNSQAMSLELFLNICRELHVAPKHFFEPFKEPENDFF